MKRVCLLVVCLMAMWGTCPGVSAQGFLGETACSGAGCFPGLWGSGGIGMPTVYVGWLDYSKGSTWELQRVGSAGTASWPLKGLWLGATKEFTSCEDIGFLISGSVFVPRRSHGTWVESPRVTDFDFDISSYQWWSIDGLVTKRISGSFELLAGLRWDHTSTRIHYNDDTSDDYTLNTYIPLVGVQIAERSCNGTLLVRFMGSPVPFGELTYAFWTGQNYAESASFALSKSHFMELFAEYNRCVGGNLTAGLFVKWNSLSVKTSEGHLAGTGGEPASWNVDIQSLVIGGSICLGFSSPL